MITRPTELATLGCFLTDPQSVKAIRQIDERWFSDKTLCAAFTILRDMVLREEEINLTTFEARWTERFPEDGIHHLITFCHTFKSSSLINSYLQILRDGAVKRIGKERLDEITKAINQGATNDTIIGLFDDVSQQLQMISGTSSLPSLENIMANVARSMTTTDAPEPLYTGLQPIDEHGGYLHDCMLLAARYGTGKTPFALRTLLHNCINNGVPAAIYSGENPNENIVRSLMAMLTGIPLRVIKMGIHNLPEQEIALLQEAQEKILDAPLYFLTWGRKEWYDIRSQFMTFHERYNTKLHIIDAFPHIAINTAVHSKRFDALVDLGNKIFEVKKDIPGLWITLDQLRTKNTDDTPILRDVMHCSQLEQNCDIGIVIDRKDKEKRTLEKERYRMMRQIQTVQHDTSLSDAQKAVRVSEIERDHVLAGVAHVSQEKGRMGYGEWRTKVGFDDTAYGFYDEFSIHPDDPRRPILIQQLQNNGITNNYTEDKDEWHDDQF